MNLMFVNIVILVTIISNHSVAADHGPTTEKPMVACLGENEIEITPNVLYACPQTSECGEGYSLCESARSVELGGLTPQICSDIAVNNEFFFTLEGYFERSECFTSDNINYITNKTNDTFIWGCSADKSIKSDCVLNSFLNAKDVDTMHMNKEFEFGMLCCKDRIKRPIIKDTIYACYAGINTPFEDIKDADINGCGSHYHICNSAKELKRLGLTNDQCTDIGGKNGAFYGTLEGIHVNTCNSSIIGVFGCSSSANNDECDPLNTVIDGDISDVDGVLCCTDGNWQDAKWINMPFMAYVFMTDRYGNRSRCGGSILTVDGHNSNGAILTAAHCVEGAASFKIFIGCTDSNCWYKVGNEGASVHYVDVNIDSVRIHPEYDTDENNNDVAIIFLNEPIMHEGAISVILESDPMIAENDGKVILTGYVGDEAANGLGRDNLEFASSNIMKRSECMEVFGTTNGMSAVIKDSTFCVRDDIATNGMVSICSGDSGSPVFYKGKQIGINSFILDCDPFLPQVAVYVPTFFNWIISECGAQCGTGEYIGCYIDKSTPALRKEILNEKGKIFSVDKCRHACNGYKYFALQNDGEQCFCDDMYEFATKYGISSSCGSSQLGGILSNSLFVHSGFEQKKYLPDDALNNGIKLRYGPGKGAHNNKTYTVESCRISCSQFKYFSVSKDGVCKCDNKYIKSYDKEYDRYGLFKNVLSDGIEINVNCDNFLNNISFINDEYSHYVSLSLISGELYPYDDWTKTQTVMLPNSANCGKVRIECANAENDNGPAGLMIGIKYNKQIISSNGETINNIIKLVDRYDNGNNNNQIVLSSQTSTTPLSDEPYFAKWIWTCGDDGEWEKCGQGLENIFEIDLCQLSVADTPNVIDLFIPKDKTVIYLFLSIISVIVNIALVYVFCCKSSSKKYTKVKCVQFDDESDVENEKV